MGIGLSKPKRATFCVRHFFEEVHKKLLWKVYNARCNEFLHSINKISCMHQNRSVDASTGLRDKLKVYAVEKSEFNAD